MTEARDRIYSGTAAGTWSSVTKADADLPGGVCWGLLVGTAGTANLTDADGNETSGVPLIAGYNMLRCKRVRLGGTADDIWALY